MPCSPDPFLPPPAFRRRYVVQPIGRRTSASHVYSVLLLTYTGMALMSRAFPRRAESPIQVTIGEYVAWEHSLCSPRLTPSAASSGSFRLLLPLSMAGSNDV